MLYFNKSVATGYYLAKSKKKKKKKKKNKDALNDI